MIFVVRFIYSFALKSTGKIQSTLTFWVSIYFLGFGFSCFFLKHLLNDNSFVKPIFSLILSLELNFSPFLSFPFFVSFSYIFLIHFPLHTIHFITSHLTFTVSFIPLHIIPFHLISFHLTSSPHHLIITPYHLIIPSPPPLSPHPPDVQWCGAVLPAGDTRPQHRPGHT